jgi:hypothetical protein
MKKSGLPENHCGTCVFSCQVYSTEGGVLLLKTENISGDKSVFKCTPRCTPAKN